MIATIPYTQIPKFVEADICLLDGFFLEDYTFVFTLAPEDHGKFLEIIREEIRAHPQHSSEALKAWVAAQESEIKWHGALSSLPDPYAHDNGSMRVPIDSVE